MTDLQTFNTLNNIMHRQRDEREANLLMECKRAWSAGGMIADKNLLTHLGYMSPDGYQRVLDEHPAKAAHDSIDNVNTAFGLLKASRHEIIKIYGQFHAQVMHDSADSGHLEDVNTTATKEVYTFSCASYSLVQAYRHFKSAVPECATRHDEVVAEVFGAKPIGDFVMGLRKSYNHQNLFRARPTYTVSLGESRTVETNLRFDRQLLLKNTEWTVAGRRFLETAAELDVIEIVNTYFALAAELHSKFVHSCGLNQNDLFKDYLRLCKARETIGLQVSLGLVLQAVAKRNVDPYVYLARFFTREEEKCIMCLPNNSAEQVDYMISIKDPLGLCSDDIRCSLHALFRLTKRKTSDMSGAKR
jgi:hypothetical protein